MSQWTAILAMSVSIIGSFTHFVMRIATIETQLQNTTNRVTTLESTNTSIFAKLDRVAESLARIEGKLGVTKS